MLVARCIKDRRKNDSNAFGEDRTFKLRCHVKKTSLLTFALCLFKVRLLSTVTDMIAELPWSLPGHHLSSPKEEKSEIAPSGQKTSNISYGIRR